MSETEAPQTDQSTALTRREERQAFLEKFVPAETMMQLEEAHNQFFGALAHKDLSVPERTVLSSIAIVQLKQALSGPILQQVIKPLANTSIGFDTDRNPTKGWNGPAYPDETILSCAAEAWLHGLPVIGNRWNIIAGQMYARQEGFELLCSNLCRFTAKVKVPEIGADLYKQGGYVDCPVTILFRRHGDPDIDDNGEEIPPEKFSGIYSCRLTRKNSVAVDYLTGKARRKGLKGLYQHLTGLSLSDTDSEEAEARVHQVGSHFGNGDEGEKSQGSRASSLAEKLKRSVDDAKASQADDDTPEGMLTPAQMREVRKLAKSVGVKISTVEGRFDAPLAEITIPDKDGKAVEVAICDFIRDTAKAKV